MKNIWLVIGLGIYSSLAEGAPLRNYNIEATAQVKSCHGSSGRLEKKLWYFGPAGSDDRCLDNKQICNYHLGFAMFHNRPMEGSDPRDIHDQLCGINPTANLCASLEIYVDNGGDGQDYLVTKTHFSQNGQRLSTKEATAISRVIDREKPYVITADGCYRYEVSVKAVKR